MYSQHYLPCIVLVIISLFFGVAAYPVENIDFNPGQGADYLWWSLDTITVYPAPQLATDPRKTAEVITVEEDTKKNGRLVFAINTNPRSTDSPRFSERLYPGLEVVREYPLRCQILDWTVCESRNGKPEIIGLGTDGDSAWAYRVRTDSGQVAYIPLTAYAKGWGKKKGFEGSLCLLEDYDYDGLLEGFFMCHMSGVGRYLYCAELNSWRLEWQCSVAAWIRDDALLSKKDSLNPGLVLATINPANGLHDEHFDDSFSYFAALDNFGNVEFARKVGEYPNYTPAMCRSNCDSIMFLAHLDMEDRQGNYVLEKTTISGAIIQRVILSGKLASMSSIPRGPDHKERLLVEYRNGYFELYDMSLDLLAVSDTSSLRVYYIDTLTLPGESSYSYVFSNGIYDRDFRKQLAFPGTTESFQPLSVDSTGSVVGLLLNEYRQSLLCRPTKKSLLDLTSVFYHSSEEYVLMVLSGLLVGLVVTNIYRRRARSNLALIAKQKAELEQMQEKLISAEKFRQAKDIAGGFAHEIKNALSPADVLLTKIRRSDDPHSFSVERLTEMTKGTHMAISRAIDITNMITQYTKLETDYMPEAVDLGAVISSVINDNRIRISEQHTTIGSSIPSGMIISGNRKQVEIVISNLLRNSLDAQKSIDDPRINIQAERKSNTVIMTFCDNGVGIEPDNIERIFDAFFSTRPDSGRGLGLSIVKRIVEIYGGKISVNSDSSKGTEFHIEWAAVGKVSDGR